MDIFKNRPLAFSLFVFLSISFISLFLSPVIIIIAFSIGIVLFILSIVWRKTFDNITGALFALCFALMVSYLAFNLIYTTYPCDGTVNEGIVEIYDLTYKSEDICYFNGEVKELNGKKTNFKCKFTYTSSNYDVNEGDIVRAQFKFVEFVSDEGFNEENYYSSLGIFNVAYIESDYEISMIGNKNYPIKNFFDTITKYVEKSFEKYTSEESSPLLISLASGDKSALSDSVIRDFSRLGISHMLAVSGMHLSVLMASVAYFTKLFELSKRNNYIFIIFICLFYILLTGASASILRSGLMFIIMHFSYFVKRTGDSLTSLLIAVSAIVLVSPAAIYDIGLILSFTSTLGILVILPPLYKYINEKSKIKSRLFWVIVIQITLTLSAVSFSLIPVLYYFDEFSLVSVFSNLIFNVFISFILSFIPVFICLSWFEIFACGLGFILDVAVKGFLFLVSYFAGFENLTVSTHFPFLWLTIVVYIIGIIAAIVINKRKLFIVGFAAWFAVFSVCISVYVSGCSNGKFIYLSEKGNDGMLMRVYNESVYLDFGHSSKRSAQDAFILLNKKLYATELDAWVIGAYSDNTISTLKEYISVNYVSEIYLPTPENSLDYITAQEVLYYANEENTNVKFYDYSKMFEVCSLGLYITSPAIYSSMPVYSANVRYKDRSIAYYSKGYFEYADYYFNSDTVFIGSNGSAKKQKNSPDMKCRSLVYSYKNDYAYTNIKAEHSVCLNENSIFYIE